MTVMANLLTTIRLFCGFLIPFVPVFSKWFFLLYLIACFTDAIDGPVARKCGKVTSFGAKFDTFSDFVFTVSVLIALIKSGLVPVWSYIWICVIFAIKTANFFIGLIRFNRLIAVHSTLNKLCGIAVFFLPLLIGASISDTVNAYIILSVFVLATVAAVDETVKVCKGKTELK